MAAHHFRRVRQEIPNKAPDRLEPLDSPSQACRLVARPFALLVAQPARCLLPLGGVHRSVYLRQVAFTPAADRNGTEHAPQVGETQTVLFGLLDSQETVLNHARQGGLGIPLPNPREPPQQGSCRAAVTGRDSLGKRDREGLSRIIIRQSGGNLIDEGNVCGRVRVQDLHLVEGKALSHTGPQDLAHLVHLAHGPKDPGRTVPLGLGGFGRSGDPPQQRAVTLLVFRGCSGLIHREVDPLLLRDPLQEGRFQQAKILGHILGHQDERLFRNRPRLALESLRGQAKERRVICQPLRLEGLFVFLEKRLDLFPLARHLEGPGLQAAGTSDLPVAGRGSPGSGFS